MVMRMVNKEKMEKLIEDTRKYVEKRRYQEAYDLVCDNLMNYPHSGVCYNLLGIILETANEHVEAMKFFRASISIDPSYVPARINMNRLAGIDDTPGYVYL